MSYNTLQTIQQLWEQFLQDQMANMAPEQRQGMEGAFEQRLADLTRASAGQGGPATPPHDGFIDMLGLSDKGAPEFNDVAYPYIEADFDESVVPSQLHAAAELYFTYMHERMKVFEVVEVLLRLFHAGKLRMNRGPGARGLYLLEKWKPLRYTRQQRMVAYKRAFNYGNVEPPAGAVVNRNFHRQFVAFMTAVSQYFRDLLIGEVIRGGQLIDQRPFGSIGTVQRVGTDLRYALDRSTYGNIYSLSMETGHYLKTVMNLLDSPDIKKAFDANTKWDVVEAVSNRHLGGTAEPSQRAKMAESGRRILQFIASNDFKTASDPVLFQSIVRPMGAHAEAWVAAYRMTPEGRGFAGITPTLQRAIGMPQRQAA